MKIKKLTLKNWCQHRSQEIQFSGNMVGVVGRNGSGKSNLVQAIADCIVGEFHKKKELCITREEKEGVISVEVQLSRQDLPESKRLFVISRNLHNNEASLTFSDGESIVSASAVNQKIQELLEVDRSVLEQIVFVQQDSISKLLFQSSSIKDRLVQKFFGIDRANSIEKTLAGMISSVQLTSLPVSIETRSLSILRKGEEIAAKQRELDALGGKRELESISEKILSQKVLIQRRADIAEARRARVRWEEDWAQTSLQLSQIKSEILRLEESCSLIENIDEARKAFGLVEKAIQLKSELISKSILQEAARKNLLGCEEELASFDRKFFNLTQARQDFSRLIEKRAVIQSQTASARKVIDAVASAILKDQDCGEQHEVSCPTCSAKISQESLDAMNVLCERGEIELEGLCKEITILEGQIVKNDHKLSEIKSLRDLRSYELSSLNTRIKELTFLIESELPESLSSSCIEELGPRHDEMKSILAKFDADFDLLKSKRPQAKLIEESASKIKLSEPPIPSGDLSESEQEGQESIEMLEEKKVQIEQCISLIQQLEASRTIMNEELELAKKTVHENTEAIQYKHSLEKVRSVFHADGAPKILVSRQFARMNAAINHYLSLFRADFRVEMFDGLNFKCHFENRKGVMYGTELSGGQKNILAVSFRFASMETFSASVGLMTLDEPSAPMDDQYVAEFGNILSTMSEMAKTNGIQFIMPTHEKSLRHVFDQIIEL